MVTIKMLRCSGCQAQVPANQLRYTRTTKGKRRPDCSAHAILGPTAPVEVK